jgi:hypothetical protein
MKYISDIWPLILRAHRAAMEAIAEPYRSEFDRLNHRFQTGDPAIVGHFVYLVENFDPACLSVETYQRRDPFDHFRVVANFLEKMADLGWLEPVNENNYLITSRGHEIRDLRWRILNPLLANQAPLPPAEMDYLLATLAHIVAMTADAPGPPEKWSLKTRLRQGLKPPPGSSPLHWFIHYRMDLGTYRDDAHLATWRDVHRMTPLAWEMLTMLWSGQADSAETLTLVLGRRGFTAAEQTAALDDLEQRGWIRQCEDGKHQLTEESQKARDTAEALTNEYFYAPWSISNEHETERLRYLLRVIAKEPLGKQI